MRRCGDATKTWTDPFWEKNILPSRFLEKKKKNMMTRNHPTAKKLNGRSLSKEPENCFIVFDSRK